MAADLARLIDRLGGIAPSRVWLTPLPGKATEADLIRVEARRDGPICELVERTLVEKVMHMRKAVVHGQLLFALSAFVKPDRLGVVLSARGMYRLAPDTVRLPGGSFIRSAKYREWAATDADIADFAPDVAVEAVSEGDTPAEMARKAREYFAAGTSLLWEIDPRRRTVVVHTGPTNSTRLTEADELTGGDVLPGFRLPLAELFADPLA